MSHIFCFELLFSLIIKKLLNGLKLHLGSCVNDNDDGFFWFLS